MGMGWGWGLHVRGMQIRVRNSHNQSREGEKEQGNCPLSFSPSQVQVKGQHIKRHIASGALAIKSCHYVWSQLQCAWLFRVIGSGQTLLLFLV